MVLRVMEHFSSLYWEISLHMTVKTLSSSAYMAATWPMCQENISHNQPRDNAGRGAIRLLSDHYEGSTSTTK